MIQIYKDRYGNTHKFDTENEVCGIPGCNNKVAAITKHNFKFSKMYCEKHSYGVNIKCKNCGKEMIISCSDFMSIYPNIPRCKQCQLNDLNKTPEMRKQAGDLGRRLFKENKGMFSKESKEKAKIASHTKEVCEIRENNKRLNGFYNENGGYQKGLKLRKDNGSLNKWIKSGEKTRFLSSFKAENNIWFYYDKLNNQYIPWDNYKAKFNQKILTKDIESFINSIKSLDIFQPKAMGPVKSYNLDDIIKLYHTFRSQESNDWAGAKCAFERSLIENSVNWFCYIKFYIDRNSKIRPLVVGKSGSLNVNSSGSDISFSTNINDGPARRFLIEEGVVWDKTQILIIKSKSEQQALFYEQKISDIYGLFGS